MRRARRAEPGPRTTAAVETLRGETVLGTDSRRERKKRALRARIYEAATHLFIEKGYEETTIDEITDAADVGRATFFNHYPSKEAILHEIAREAIAYARRTFDREFHRKPAPIADKITRSLQDFARVVERNPKYYQNVFLDVMRSQAGFAGANRDTGDHLIDALAEHLRAEQRSGELDPGCDPAQLAEMLTGVYMYTILSGIHHGLAYSLVERMRTAVEIFLRGCAAGRTRRPRAGTAGRSRRRRR
jgi:AcrR family transcriptional regulator